MMEIFGLIIAALIVLAITIPIANAIHKELETQGRIDNE